MPLGLIEIDIIDKKYSWSEGINKIIGISSKMPLHKANDFVIQSILKEKSKLTFKDLSEIVRTGYFSAIWKIEIQKHTKILQISLHGIGKKKYQIYVSDVSKYDKNVKKLKRSSKKYLGFLNETPFGLIISKNETIEFINKKIAHLLGYNNKREILGKTVYDFISVSEFEKIISQTRLVINNKSVLPLNIVVKLNNRFGNSRFWEVTISSMIYSKTNYVQFMVRDITEDMTYDNELRQKLSDALYKNQKNQALIEIRAELERIITKHQIAKGKFKNIYEIIDSYIRLDKDWNKMISQFEKVYPGFFVKLLNEFPKLTVNDLKHCACIKMNFDTKETAQFFNVKTTSVQIARVRLKKKLLISEDQDLRSFIIKFQ